MTIYKATKLQSCKAETDRTRVRRAYMPVCSSMPYTELCLNTSRINIPTRRASYTIQSSCALRFYRSTQAVIITESIRQTRAHCYGAGYDPLPPTACLYDDDGTQPLVVCANMANPLTQRRHKTSGRLGLHGRAVCHGDSI